MPSYPGPRSFSWFFFFSRSGEHDSRSGEREKENRVYYISSQMCKKFYVAFHMYFFLRIWSIEHNFWNTISTVIPIWHIYIISRAAVKSSYSYSEFISQISYLIEGNCQVTRCEWCITFLQHSLRSVIFRDLSTRLLYDIAISGHLKVDQQYRR